MNVFPNFELIPFPQVKPGSMCATVRSSGLAIGLVVRDMHDGGSTSWIRFSDGAPGEKWQVSPIDPEMKESVVVFEGARITLLFEPNAAHVGRYDDAKLAGSAFLNYGKIAISGLVHPDAAALFGAEDGSYSRPRSHLHPRDFSLTYFSSWTIEVPDGAANWRTIFSKSP